MKFNQKFIMGYKTYFTKAFLSLEAYHHADIFKLLCTMIVQWLERAQISNLWSQYNKFYGVTPAIMDSNTVSMQ